MSEEANTEISEEERQLFDNAKVAAAQLENYSTAQVRAIYQAIGEACLDKAEFYAEWTVADTGFGNVQDKIAKKMMAAQGQLEEWDPADFIEPVVDYEKKIVSYPKPAGIMIQLLPCTNPMFGLIAAVMQAVITRNVMIVCPHPGAREVSLHAVDFIHDVGVAAGAPENFLQTLRGISISAVSSIMHTPDSDLSVAVGGPAMVHAAYTSGNPALGVGAGNCPCYVHESADPAVVGPVLTVSSSWDWSLPCTSESVILCDRAIVDDLRAAMKAANGYFPTLEEETKLRELCWQDGAMNRDMLGKSPVWIAEAAGIEIPADTRTIVIEIGKVGQDEPVSKEKMFPLVGLKLVDGVEEAIADALAMLEVIGKGHSASVHTADPEIALRYGSAMPVTRVAVNGSNSEVVIGAKSGLPAVAMMGTGFWGGSLCSDPHPNDFLQWTRLAYHDDCEISMNAVATAMSKLNG